MDRAPENASNMIKAILLVEDDPNDVFFFKHSVQKAGIFNPVLVASDGREALDCLEGAGRFADREKYPVPCLVVLDLKLPGLSGLEFLRYLREKPELRKLIVVVLTSSLSGADIAQAYELGANAYLVKPSDPDQLTRIVQAIKDFWLTHNLPPQINENQLGQARQVPERPNPGV